MLDGDRLLAATGGEVFCLDSATGETLWRNNLPGMGYGLVSLASGSTPHSVPSAQQARKLEEEQAAMLAATDVTTQY
jgi:outer membrane protein assembly factor BamB